MNRAEIDDLPAVVDVCTAAKVLGLSRTAAYELIRLGEWPTPVFRLGKLIRIPTAPMRELLGIDPTLSTGAGAGSPDVHRSAG
jgi:predicted DNA-binding transcriptional regulator AlpA